MRMRMMMMMIIINMIIINMIMMMINMIMMNMMMIINTELCKHACMSGVQWRRARSSCNFIFASYIIAMCVSSLHHSTVCFIIALQCLLHHCNVCFIISPRVFHHCNVCFIIAMCVSSLHWLLHHHTVCFIIALILPILIIIIMTMEAPSMACAENSRFVRETTQSVSKRSDI